MIPTTSAEFEECRVCAGSGFSGNGSGYDAVCGSCGGQKYMPRQQPSVTASEPTYGIIDPDYARVFTIARCIAWQEGYALVMHGSFTRDLDLLAVPWTERATDAEHLIKRIAFALDDLSLLKKSADESVSQATDRPHGRKSWTFTFKAFGDPRFIDISVMPCTTQQPAALPREDEIALERRRIQALGAALSRRDWSAAEQAYNAIRDHFDRIRSRK